MEEESVESMREINRNSLIVKRRIHRDDESDVRRQLAELKISSDNILDISNKLKTKSMITASELRTLKNGLIDDAKNIELFLNTHGALRGLVRELSGHDDKKQLMAAGCCCNLALGDTKACMVVAKATGSYLITALDLLNEEMTVTCAWTLGNLAGADARVCAVVAAQGALAKLCEVLHAAGGLVRDAAVYALVRLTYTMKDELSLEYLDKILKGLVGHPLTMESSQLIFILSCHEDFPQSSIFEKELYHVIMETVPAHVDSHINNCKSETCCQLEFLLRILANVDPKLHSVTVNKFLASGVMNSIRRLLDNDVMKGTVMWFLGNLINYGSSELFR